MSSCDKIVGPGAAGAYMGDGQGCACVYLDAAGVLMVDGVPYAGSGGGGVSGPVNPNTGLSAGSLNPLVTVAPSQLSGGALPASVTLDANSITGLCPKVVACLTPGSVPPAALGAGNLPATTKVDAASITPGAAGTVLTSTATGSVWAAASGGGSGPVDPATGVLPGTLASNVLVPAASIVGALPASAIPCSAVIACVSSPGSIPANAIGSGALGSGVTLPGTQITGGAAGQYLSSDGTKGVWVAAPSGGTAATAETLGGSALNPAIGIPAASVLPGNLASGVNLSGGTAGQVYTSNGTVGSWQTPTATPAGGPISPSTGIAAGTLASTVLVPGSSIVGPIPDSAVPCSAVLACVSNAPNGSIPVSKLAPGTSGQVLSTNASGATVWATPAAASGAPTAAQIATAMDAATPATSPTTGTGLAQVYGENASGAPVTASPMQSYEAAVAQAPASSASATLDRVSGVTSTGAAVDAKVRQVGTVTIGQSTNTTDILAGGGNTLLCTVVAPTTGLYAIDIDLICGRTLTNAATFSTYSELAHALVIINETQANSMLYHSNSIKPLTVTPGLSLAAGADLGVNVNRGTVVVTTLKAGDKLRLELNNLHGTVSQTFTHFDPANLNLTKLADNDLVLV